MKKLFSIAAVLLFALAATFAQAKDDTVITVDNFNEPWIIGTWTMELQASGNGQESKETATCEITGSDDSSIVKTIEKNGTVTDETLQQVKDAFAQLIQTGVMFEQLAAQGAELIGSPNLYLNADKTRIYYNIGVSFQNETATITILMEKK